MVKQDYAQILGVLCGAVWQRKGVLRRLRRNIDMSVCGKDESCAYRQSGFTHTHPVSVAVCGCCCWLCALLLLLLRLLILLWLYILCVLAVVLVLVVAACVAAMPA